jgi:hypothetical protein
MPVVRPISDFQTSLAEIIRAADDTAEPVFFAEKDYGDFVFMSKGCMGRQKIRVRNLRETQGILR